MKLGTAGQRGSIPLTLLVTIVLAGVIVALFTVVRTGVDSSGRDRDFASAIQVADAGVQQAYLSLLELDDDELEDPTTPVGCDPAPGAAQPTVQEGLCVVEVDDGEYVWSYERLGTSRNWRVESWGTYRDSTRLVSSFVGEDLMFRTAILSVDSLDFAGGGTSVSGGTCNIEEFSIGAGGQVKLTGQTGACISQITVYNNDLTDVPGSDYGTFSNDCDPDNLEECGLFYEDTQTIDELENLGAQAFEGDGECSSAATHIPSLPAEIFKGETYCLNGNVDLSGTRTVIGPDGADQQATVYVKGNLTFTANSETNNGGQAGDLLFNVGGTTVVIRSTSKSAAAVHAPTAFCHSQGGAGTNGTFAGALVCGSVQISGNWTYDSSVEDIGGSDFAIRNWAERPPRGGPPSP